jgi:hypothetical protein
MIPHNAVVNTFISKYSLLREAGIHIAAQLLIVVSSVCRGR